MSTDPTTPPLPPNIKPGYRTSEFWLKLAATALSVLFASGALTSNTALAIAGMAASMLGALGYTVSRTLVKTAGVLLLVVFVSSSVTACSSPAVKAIEKVAWDCTATERKQAVDLLTPLMTSVVINGVSADGKSVDLSPLKTATSKAALLTDVGVILNPPAATLHALWTAQPFVELSALSGAWLAIKPDALFITKVRDEHGAQVVM